MCPGSRMEEKMEIGTNSTADSPASPAPVEIETLKKEKLHLKDQIYAHLQRVEAELKQA